MEPTTLDIVTLVIAVVGLLTGVGSLVWQVAAWRLEGSVVVTKAGWGILTMTDGSLGPVIITIEASNRGRTAVTVTGWGLELPGGQTIVGIPPPPSAGPRLPHRLEAGDSATWYMVRDEARHSLVGHGHRLDTKLRAFVNLGTGEKRRSKKTFTLSKR